MPLSDFATAQPQTKPPKRVSTARVVLVQSICCAVLVLFVALFKVCGGSAYLQLRDAFHAALENNALLTSVVKMFDAPPQESYLLSGGTTAADTATTAADTATTTADSVTTTAETATTTATAATTVS